jgi:Trypsin-co-occurring domain 2
MQGIPEGIGLDEALEALRAELASAQVKAAGQDLQFPCRELDDRVEGRGDAVEGGEGGFSCSAHRGGAGRFGWVDRQTLQTVTLVLGAPVDQHGNPVKVTSASEEPKG